MLWKIVFDDSDPTISFAAEELKHYLGTIDSNQEIVLLRSADLTHVYADALYLAVSGRLLSDGEDKTFDDAIWIDVQKGCGHISGSNPRSVLIGVYRFLAEIGCAWIRPGKEGEIIPRKSLDTVSVSLTGKPSYRHRGMAIEGAVSADHVLDMIDWLPKAGMNAYFIQFLDVPFVFYDRWYAHLGNETLQPTPLQVEEVRAIKFRTVDQIKKRGLLYHAAGHGWTCEPFGIPGNTWDETDHTLTDEQRSSLAEVKGRRGLWKGIALNTNLCYSKGAVRSRIAQAVVDYIQKNPQADVLHLWLADDSNNQCECAACREKRPADWYLILLNEVDRLMGENGLSQKVVFLLYVDLLWPPVTETLQNPERFIMMFAPITRSYSESYADAPWFQEADLPDYARNHLSFPKSVGENLAWLRKWQQKFSCDSFAFDYHYMWDHFFDPGYYQMSEILLNDVKSLRGIGMNGLVSCQAQRTWFPTGLGMHLMAAGLWNRDIDFEQSASDYFLQAFGEDGLLAKEYLRRLSAAFEPRYLRRETGPATDRDLQRLTGIHGVIRDFMPTIQRHLEGSKQPAAVRLSWKYLTLHAEYCKLLADALVMEINDKDASHAEFEKVYQWARAHEWELSPVLDVFELQYTLRCRGNDQDAVFDDATKT